MSMMDAGGGPRVRPLDENLPFDDWASRIADGVEAKSPSQLEYEIEEALQKAYRLGAAELTDLRGERNRLGRMLQDAIGEMDKLRVERDTLRGAGAALQQQLAKVEADVARLRSRGQTLRQQWMERGAALCPNRSEHDVATRDLGYMERVERPMGALLFECANQLAALLPDAPTPDTP